METEHTYYSLDHQSLYWPMCSHVLDKSVLQREEPSLYQTVSSRILKNIVSWRILLPGFTVVETHANANVA